MDKNIKYKQNNTSDFSAFFRSFFSFFNLTQARRMNAEKPKDLRTWIIHGISEFIGTIFISLGLAGLSIYVAGSTDKPLVIEEFLLHPIIVGFYAGFIVVGLCLFIFLRWSCDLNPSVSLYRYINGTNNGYYTTYKIIIQFLGAIVAACIIYLVGHATAPEGVIANAPIDAISAAHKAFETETTPSIASGTAWIFFVELVMTSILLFPIFSPNINGKYRDLMIMFIISMSVWMGILGGSAAINPARGLAQQLPTLMFHTGDTDLTHYFAMKNYKNLGFGEISQAVEQTSVAWKSVVSASIIMVIADLLAPIFYAFVQGLTKTLVNPFVVKVISYKNYKALNMEKPSDKNKNMK
ncbi:aquaporin [Mycoplasma buteonis]|uniref:aquaporin n=1 Tax=Mycoplasma buteonis TaxID=171280 RepID=UPI0005632312|nr:aquaporin [Mycoplasma buteonis]